MACQPRTSLAWPHDRLYLAPHFERDRASKPGVKVMMRNSLRLLLPILGGLLVCASSTRAQTIPSPYRYVDERQSISVFGGYLATDAGRLDLGPESSPLFGARYSIRLGGPFDAEARATFIPTTRTVWDTTAVAGELLEVGEADLSLALLEGSLRFNLTGPRTYRGFMPYFLAGGGVALTVSDDEALENEAEIGARVRFDFGTRFAGHVGAGIEWFVTRRLALRAEARDVFWRLPTPPGLADFLDEVQSVPDSEWVQNFEFSLGAAFHF